MQFTNPSIESWLCTGPPIAGRWVDVKQRHRLRHQKARIRSYSVIKFGSYGRRRFPVLMGLQNKSQKRNFEPTENNIQISLAIRWGLA